MADGLSHDVIGAAIEVHRVLGPGLLESIYESALCREFELRGVPYQRQCFIDVFYKGRTIHGQRLDLVIDRRIVVEVKSLRTLPDVAVSQILSYLRASGLHQGLILNFGVRRLVDGIRRVTL